MFYSFVEIGTTISNAPVIANLTMAASVSEKIVLAFSTNVASGGCSGTLFQVLNEAETQYYQLTLVDKDSLKFEFRLLTGQVPVIVPINVQNLDFCDTTRHIVNIERTADHKITYRIDGRKVVEKEYRIKAYSLFVKPYNYYVGNTKAEDDPFVGCISGAKFHLFTTKGQMMTVEPIKVGVRSSNSSCKLSFCCKFFLGPSNKRIFFNILLQCIIVITMFYYNIL